MLDNTNATAEVMLEELAQLALTVAHQRNSPQSTTQPAQTTATVPVSTSAIGVSAELAALTPSATHIGHSRALGIEPATLCAGVRQHIADAVEALKQFSATMPAGDANIAKINDLIARLN